MSDLRCRQCGARLQPTADWCSLCHTPKAPPAAALPADAAVAGGEPDPQPSGNHRRPARQSRLVAGAAATVVAAATVAVVLSLTPGSHKAGPPHAPVHNTLGIPSTDNGLPADGRIPLRVSR